MKAAFMLMILLFYQFTYAQKREVPVLKFEGLRIWVDDLKAAEQFYSKTLGFEVDHKDLKNGTIRLKSEGFLIYLTKAQEPSKSQYGRHIRTSLTLQVPKLLPAIDQLRNAGVTIEALHLQRNGVGISIPFKDPAGNLLSLMEVQMRSVAPFEGFKIYNAGITTSAMDKAIAFYVGELSFAEWSRDYLPAAMPLKHSDESFAFMLHEKPGLKSLKKGYSRDSDINLIFSTKSLKALNDRFLESNINTRPAKAPAGLMFTDPFGNHLEVIEK